MSLLVFFFFLGCSPKEKKIISLKKLHICSIAIKTVDGRTIPFKIEIAENDKDRQKGLMFRKHMPENHGMLFIFKEEISLAFWMKNTYIPLDIAYISKSYKINEIYFMKPLDTSVTYPSKKPAMYALEMNAKWFKRNNIKPGDQLKLNGCFGQ